MKKKLVSALALMMSCVMLAACGGNKVEENTAIPQTETSEAVTESTEEAASTETEAAGELTDVNVAALKGPTAMGMVKLMDDSDNLQTVQADPDLIEKRKRELWTIVVVMLVSFCVGTFALLALLWYVIKIIMPELSY